MFPGGRAGAALLLLRLGLGGAIWFGAGMDSSWVDVISELCALAIGFGLLTPLAAGSYLALSLAWHLSVGELPPTQACMWVNAAVLGLLGPGAYSLDARLFGRQRVIMTRLDDEHGDGR